jgi:hypothetical protein
VQEKIQNISPIKSRILQFIEYLGISKREFYLKTNISRGTLESNTGITEDTLAKFFAVFKDADPVWIILGVGKMLLNGNSDYITNGSKPELNEPIEKHSTCQKCKDKDELLQSNRELIDSLKQQINTQSECIEHLKSK